MLKSQIVSVKLSTRRSTKFKQAENELLKLPILNYIPVKQSTSAFPYKII